MTSEGKFPRVGQDLFQPQKEAAAPSLSHKVLASLLRLHIVAIAIMGTVTFSWLFTGRREWGLALVAGLDWFLVNLLNRVADLPEDQKNRVLGASFSARHGRAIKVTFAIFLLASLPMVHAFEPKILPMRLAYHLLGLLYNLPLLKGPGRLKRIYLVKNLASATGFLLTVVGYPLVARDVTVSPIYVLTFSAFFFCTELAYEVIYDLRDVQGDRAEGIPTFPAVHGERVGRIVAWSLSGLGALILSAGYAFHCLDWRAFIMVFGPLVQAAYLYLSLRHKGPDERDCVRLTWIGVGLLTAYNLWVILGLPLDPFGP